MMLADRGEPWEWLSEDVREAILEYGDVFACPVLVRGDLVLSQTPAILAYLGEELGYNVPKAHTWKVQQVSLDIADIWAEAYNFRKTANKATVVIFYERLRHWYGVLEKVAAAHEGPYLFGPSPLHVDFGFLNTYRTVIFMFGEDSLTDLSAYPRLSQSVHAMLERPGIKKYLEDARPVLYPSVAFANLKEPTVA